MQLRRIAIALGISITMVVIVAALLPRAYLVNDDAGFVLYLRQGLFAPWMSTVLNAALVSLYSLSADVPWYGLYLYALIVAVGAVLIHTCIELIDPRPGLGRVATWLGAIMLGTSHIILAIGVSWTTVSISAMGTALVAFVAHLQTCEATNTPASPVRAVIYGLLFVAGFVLREAAIAAIGAALLPLLGWIGVRFLRHRYLPRPAALLAFVAPFAIVVAVGGRISQPEETAHAAFNEQRGRISGAAAFADLDTRAPDLLARAGWSLDDYRDFSNWLLADDTEFSTEKVKRLADTGGVPTRFGLAESYNVLRGVVTDSPASVWLFLTAVAGALALAWLGIIARRSSVVFSLGYLLFLMVVPVALSAVSRFPQRLSLSFYTVAAFGMFVFLAGEIARRPPLADSDRRPDLALLVISLFMLPWAKHLVEWTKRDSWPYHSTLRDFADRVNARKGIVMMAAGIAEMDPLLADPRGYDALPSGWGTFTAGWYDYIERFGIHSGSELLHKMVDNPNAYVVGQPYGVASFEEWLRRRLRNPEVRLTRVDVAAGMPTSIRSELYRVVTTPLVPGSAEWQERANLYLPEPPDVSSLAFRPLAFSAPYEQYLAPFREAAAGIVEPLDGGIRLGVSGAADDACTTIGHDREYAGVQMPVHGLAAARFDIQLVEPDNIVGLYVTALTDTRRSVRWRWEPDLNARTLPPSGPFTLVPGYSSSRLALVGNTANPDEIRSVRVFVELKPGTHGGFELRHVEISEAAAAR